MYSVCTYIYVLSNHSAIKPGVFYFTIESCALLHCIMITLYCVVIQIFMFPPISLVTEF